MLYKNLNHLKHFWNLKLCSPETIPTVSINKKVEDVFIGPQTGRVQVLVLSEQVLLEQEALRVLQQCSDAPHEREHEQALNVLGGRGAFRLVENIFNKNQLNAHVHMSPYTNRRSMCSGEGAHFGWWEICVVRLLLY